MGKGFPPKELTEARKAFPYDALDRLAAADKAISEMTEPERLAAFEWMKSKYRSEWPSDM